VMRLEQLEVEVGDEIPWEIHAAEDLCVMVVVLYAVFEAA